MSGWTLYGRALLAHSGGEPEHISRRSIMKNRVLLTWDNDRGMRSLRPIIRANKLTVLDLGIFVHKFVGQWDLKDLEALLNKAIMDSTVWSRILGYGM